RRVLVPEYQEFGIPGRLTPGQHHRTAEQTAREQAADGEDHSAMLSARKTAPARPDRVIEPYRSEKQTGTSLSTARRVISPSKWPTTVRLLGNVSVSRAAEGSRSPIAPVANGRGGVSLLGGQADRSPAPAAGPPA